MQSELLLPFPAILDRILDRQPLETDDAEALMDQVLAGEMSLARTAALVTALRAKPLEAAELAGFARSLRRHAEPFPKVAGPLLDNCGTGAAPAKTFNVSTLAAFAAAAAGVRVAKHGNRSVTRPSGSSDLLRALGYPLDLTPEQAAQTLEASGIVFLHAPAYHPSMRHTGPVRQELGIRTVFNLLGPLANPMSPTHQVLGVHDSGALRPMATALRRIGVREGYVLHGFPGHDEASLSGATSALRIHDGHVGGPVVFTPEELGFEPAPAKDVAPLSGDLAQHARSILRGEGGARSRIVALNAAFAIHCAGRAPDLASAAQRARELLADGSAVAKMEEAVAAARTCRP